MREPDASLKGALALPPSPTAEERRVAARRLSPLAVACMLLDEEGGAPLRAEFRDVSAFGAGLLLPRPVPTRALLRIGLPGTARTVLGRVVHATPEARGWLAGCAFVGELDDGGLRPFGVARLASPPGDARRWTRFPCGAAATVVAQDATGERVAARVLDASAGGVGLSLPRRFPPGALIGLGLAGTASPALLLRVVRAERAAGGWFLGCEFAARLGGPELASLCGKGAGR